MPIEGKPNVQGYKERFTTSRRGLFAAAAIFAATVSTRKAHALSRPPWERPRGGGAQCLVRGTHVLTPRGEIKVEELTIGDLVNTIDGSAKPIKWIGRRSYDHVSMEMLPIKIARSALGHLIPRADLYVSPLHAFYIDGVLVPARNLVNGRSITHCSSVDFDTVDYFHVELEAHDVIFTEGAPTETLLVGCRRAFDNWPEDTAGYVGDAHSTQYAPRLPANTSAAFCSRLRSAVSPLVDIRRPGDGIWERLAERAETQIAA